MLDIIILENSLLNLKRDEGLIAYEKLEYRKKK